MQRTLHRLDQAHNLLNLRCIDCPHLHIMRGLTRSAMLNQQKTYNTLCTAWTRHTKYSVRCKQCNKDNSALQRLFTKEPSLRQSLQEKFSSEQQSRSEFIRRSRGLIGKELMALVETMVCEKTSEVKLATRERTTEY